MTGNPLLFFILTLLSCTPGHGTDITAKSEDQSGTDKQLLQPRAKPIWLSPNEIMRRGLGQSRVVIMNEAHNGNLRNVRTRRIGKSILATAHELGVRHLAMEALTPNFADISNRTRKPPKASSGYLSQPEMISLIQAALDLGWTIIPYEADGSDWIDSRFGPRPDDPDKLAEYREKIRKAQVSMEYTNWRELEQTRNLIAILNSLPTGDRLLVWCGNGHLTESPIGDWLPMGYQFAKLSGLNPFTIDQTRTVEFGNDANAFRLNLARQYGDELRKQGGTAGFLKEEGPDILKDDSSDAFLLSMDNKLE